MKKYLISLGLKDFEANYILGQVENADEFTAKELKENTNVLLKYVPKESLTQIILLTPSIVSGALTSICLPNLPERVIASSRTSTILVSAIT